MDKKDLRNQIEAKLEAALAEFAKGVSEKKFKKHVKKASKLLSEGLAVPAEEKVEKPAKKAKVPKAAPATEVVEIKKAPKKAPVKQAKKAATPAKKKSPAKEAAENPA
jgi:predicted kinase